MLIIIGVLLIVGALSLIYFWKPGSDGVEKAFIRRRGGGAIAALALTSLMSFGIVMIALGTA